MLAPPPDPHWEEGSTPERAEHVVAQWLEALRADEGTLDNLQARERFGVPQGKPGSLKEARYLAPLCAALETEASAQRCWMILCLLKEIGDPQAVPSLIVLIERWREVLGAQEQECLDNPERLTALNTLLMGEQHLLKEAIALLATLGRSEVVPYLFSLLAWGPTPTRPGSYQGSSWLTCSAIAGSAREILESWGELERRPVRECHVFS